MTRVIAIVVAAVLTAGQALALECGGETNPCRIANGEYHIAVPEGGQGGPAVMHLHGYGGSGVKILRNKSLIKKFTDRGYAVIAPTALPWRKDKPNDWSVDDGYAYPRDDFEFLQEVLADAVEKAGVDPDRILLTGFSRGGSMVWDMACRHPDFARAFAPVAGGFWWPMPEACAGPVHLLHMHGFADTVVPLEGRQLNNTEFGVFVQGDIWEGFQLWRSMNDCKSNAAAHEITGDFWRKQWACEKGDLEILLHKGGHGLPRGWIEAAVAWFETLED